ncbi:hypothetical protein C0J50_18824 [Silurus asotus]|uniref:Uncharacterized protein n=1 Tax=Silurus asotus TaxID=30991 RepID=A0AAD5ASW0_SILAS|nr:hypothetical protein C0J50_18824 [Silurus asotus]
MNQFERIRDRIRRKSRDDPRVKELEDKLKHLVVDMEHYKAKVGELEKVNSTHPKDISKLRVSLKEHEKVRKSLDCERAHWKRERQHLEERVAQLESTLEFEKRKWEVENERIKLETEKAISQRNDLSCIKATVKFCEDQQKIVEEARKKRMEAQKQLQKAALQVANLNAALRQQELETNKIRWNMEERNSTQLLTISKLENSLRRCDEDKISAERETESLLREQEQLLKRIAQLEAMLAFEQEKRSIKTQY